MEEDGWVTSFEEQEGNRPQRQVYKVTEAGEAAFYDLLRDNLAAPPSPEFPGVVGLDFLFIDGMVHHLRADHDVAHQPALVGADRGYYFLRRSSNRANWAAFSCSISCTR